MPIFKSKIINNKKAASLKRVIIAVALFTLMLLVILGVSFFSYRRVQMLNQGELNKLSEYINTLGNKTNKMRLEIDDARKYRKVWETIPKNKKNFDGVKIAEINDNFSKLSEQYNLSNPLIKVSIPETLESGIFKRQTFDVLLSSVSISFDSFDDVRALSFVKSFLNTMPGYIVITNFDISKANTDPYSEGDLINISVGKGQPVVKARLDFAWYAFKRKTAITN